MESCKYTFRAKISFSTSSLNNGVLDFFESLCSQARVKNIQRERSWEEFRYRELKGVKRQRNG